MATLTRTGADRNRSGGSPGESTDRSGYRYDDGDLVVRSADYIVIARGQVLVLPRRVLFLLFEFARRPGVVRTRADLADASWGPVARRVKLQSIDQAVSRLRSALAEALPELAYIHTHQGVGYRFQRRSSGVAR